MSASVGPHLLRNENLVFGYDVNDYKNSFKGKPLTNLVGYFGNAYGETNNTYFKTHYYTNVQAVPRLGTVTVNAVNTFNDYSGGSGVCCEQLFNFGSTSAVGSTVYTYSLIYRSASGYNHPNLMYKYEYGASGYITEGGVFNASNQYSLGNGWYHAWGTFTTNAATTSMNMYCYIYEYGVYNTIEIAAVMLIKGNLILPPEQFIPIGATISNTTSLLDLTKTNTIDLTSTTFDSNGFPTFDGTSSRIIVNNNASLKNNMTSIEFIIKYNSTPAGDIIQFGVGSGTYAQYYYRLEGSSTTWNWFPTSGYGYYGRIVIPNSSFTTGQYYHVVMTGDLGANVQFFINGVAQSGATTGATTVAPTWTPNALTIGGYTWDGYSNSTIPVVRIYNRVLSTTEITRNYNTFKKRFNLT